MSLFLAASMTTKQFDQLAAAHRLRGLRTLDGCRLVLVHGLTAYAAALEADIGQGALSRALAKLRSPLCQECGQPMPK